MHTTITPSDQPPVNSRPAPTEGQLAEQRHQYRDLDPDSSARPAGFYSPACPPKGDRRG